MYAESQARTTWDWLPAKPADSRSPVDERRSTFGFVQALAEELSRGRVDLPASPDVVQQMQHVLDAGDLSNTTVTRVISADPGLAANVLALANGRPGERGARSATDLRLAVMRVGPDRVRSEALPYVMAKIRSAGSHAHLGSDLARLWQRSTRVAAIARLLAERTHAASPDAALLAGLLHNVGAVYLLSRSHRHVELFSDPVTRDMLMRDWQAAIGKAIAHNWGLPDEIADAIGEQDQLDRPAADARNLAGVLCVAVHCAASFDQAPDGEPAFQVSPLCRWLGLDGAALRHVRDAATRHTAALRAALALDQ